MADAVVDLLEAVDVDHHEREPALIAQGAIDLACERLVEVAPVVETGQRVEVGELPRLPEPARVLDRRRDALGDLLEGAQVVVAELDARLAREDAQPADPAAARDEGDAERLVHRAARALVRVEVRELDRARIPLVGCAGEDSHGPVLVEPDRPEQPLVGVPRGLELHDRGFGLRERHGRLERLAVLLWWPTSPLLW